MTTTKQSTFGATLRTTILLASLSGLLVVIGVPDRRCRAPRRSSSASPC